MTKNQQERHSFGQAFRDSLSQKAALQTGAFQDVLACLCLDIIIFYKNGDARCFVTCLFHITLLM